MEILSYLVQRDVMAQMFAFGMVISSISCALVTCGLAVYVTARLIFSLLGQVELYKYRRASVRIRRAQARQGERNESRV